MKAYKEIGQLIGHTPLYTLENMTSAREGAILGKIEYTNPGKSIKDRVAFGMIQKAREEGLIEEGGTIVEPTSGNTGIGLAMVAASLGYHLILVMPESLREEMRTILACYGAELILTPAEKGMRGAVLKARELVEENPSYYMPQQFENPMNPEIHRKTTGPEIIKQTGGRIQAFVTGVGTGGTLTGVGEVLKEYNPAIEIIAVEPSSSPILSGGRPGPTRIQGLGAGFIPKVLNQDIYDSIITIKDREAFKTALQLAKREGLLCGISSGANIAAAKRVAKDLGKGARVVTILPDSGDRYIELYKNLSRELLD